jgi:predicted class III extradiol MEMO1 family dioxygenase
MKTRRAMLSGTWYSGTASGCRQEIEYFIKNSTVLLDLSCPDVGGIVPHAGWSYSGSIGCDVIRWLSSGVSSPDALVIFGTHLSADSPVTIMKEEAWETPLGEATLQWVREINDRSVIAAILSMNPIGILQDAQQKHNACCAGAAAAALTAGMALGAVQSKLVTYSTSHEKNPGDNFVGYAGIVF